MAEDPKISDDEILSALKGEKPTVSQPVYSKEEAKGISDEAMLSAFKGNAPGMQTSGGTLSSGGEMFRPEMVGSVTPPEQSSLIGSGALGSGQFAPIPVGPKGKFEEYAGITDPNTRKGIAETVFKGITDPHDLEELHDKVPWYNLAENPVQMESLFQYKWNKKADPFELAADAAKAGMGMLESLPPLAGGAGRLAKDVLTGAVYAGSPEDFGKGRTLTEEQKKGLSEQEIRDAELSLRDKTYRSARVFGDAALEAEEQLRKAVTSFAEGKSMLYDKARVAFANAGDYGDFSGLQATPESIQESEARKAAKTAELMADARKNFATRINAKHVEHLQKEKNPAVLARELSAVWQYPAVKSFATDVIENLMPPAEDAAPGFGGDIEAARAARRAQAAEAAEVGVQSAITEANRLREDPEQVGAVAMTTPVNVVGAGGMILGGLGRVNQALVRGLKALGKTDQEINAMLSAERATVQAQREAAALAREQPGRLESALGSMADTADKIPGALAKIPQPVQYIGSTLLGAGAGAAVSDDPLAGALKGATTGAGIKLGGKAILAAPRLGQELLKAGRLSGAELGRFEAMEKMGSASPAVQKFVNWSQKAGGGKALDFIEKNANVFVQHNVSMMPMMMALGILEDKDAKEFSQMWAEFATYGFLHGQVLGGMLGNDPVRMKMNRDSEMRQAQRVMQASSPETRENLRNLNWDRVVEHSEARLERTKAEYAKQLETDPDSPEAAQAKSDYDFAHQIHRQNLIAPPEARAAFEDGIKLSLAKASNLINGVLTPNSNMNVELLTTPQIYKKMIDANPNYNGVGAPLTMEQAMAMNPGADGVKIGKGISKDGFTMDAAKDTVFVNIDNAMNKARLSGEAIPNVLAHEVVGHGLFSKEEYRQKIAPLYNQMFGTEVMDENGNWREVTPAQPGMSREDLFEKFFTKYLKGKTPESVAQYAKAQGVWDELNNTFDKNKVIDLMREETLAEAHAGRFFSDPESPAQRGISWLASRISGSNLKAALNHLYSIAGPAVYNQWTSGVVGVTYSPEVMRAIRNVEREMKKYDGDFVDAEQGEAVAAPITKKDVIKSREMLQKYYGDTGKFETTPVAVVTDKNGKVVQTIDLKDKEAFEGSWNYHQDEATGDNVPNKEKGFGELPPELAGVEVPVGGRVQVQRQIAYDEATGKPVERKNKETVEALKRRVQMLREAIDNAGDPSQLGRFRAVKGGQGKDDQDLHYTGKMTPEQRAAIAALPESVVPASMKELLFKYDDLMTRGDGTVLDIDYASRLNDKGNYQAFSPKIRQIVPLQLHLSKAGNFYTTAWDISDLRRKVKLYEKYAKGVFEPWGGDTQKFWNEFRTILLPKLANPDANVPGWQGLDADPNVAKLKRTIYEKMLGEPNPNVPNIESIPDLPREKFSRSEKKLDKQSSFDQIIKSFRLDSHTAAEENAATHLKYPIPYKARFMPEQEQAEEQRPAFGGGILKGLQAVSAKYDPKGTGEVKATVQPAITMIDPSKIAFKEKEQERGKIDAIKQAYGEDPSQIEWDEQPKPIVSVDKNGKMQVEDGHHRMSAFRELGYNQVPAIVVSKEQWDNLELKNGLTKAGAMIAEVLGDSATAYQSSYQGAMKPAEAQVRFMPEKLDAEYTAAFEAKDEQKARALVDEVAKKAGYNYKVHRGVENDYLKGDGYVFGKADQTYFTSDKDKAKSYAYGWSSSEGNPAVYDVYLKMENPWIPDKITKVQGWEYDVPKLKAKGYDGVIGSYGGIEGAKNGQVDIAVAFEPSQIKSADPFTYDNEGKLIPLSERFNAGTGDVRFMPAREEEPEKAKQRSSLRVKMTRETLTDAALSQASWKDWYSEHQETLDDFFGDNAPLFQNILAITSQAASVKANVGLALKAFGQLMRGEEFTGYLPAVAGNLGKLRDAAGPSGQKIQAYKAANEGDASSVVVDRHIARLLFGVDTPTPKQFAKAAKVLTQIAEKIGWTPAQVQAALWAHSIVQSGKQPESYGNYLKRLESQGGITKRIGGFGEGGAGVDVVGGSRGRYSPNDEGSLSRVTPVGEEGAETRFMPNVAVVPERFTGTAEEERRGKYVEPPKFFNKFNISQYEKGGKFFDAETGEDLTDKSYENASIAVVNGKPSLVANNEAETTGTGPLFKTNLFKQKAGWKWVSEDAPDTSTIVSVEGQGKHLYALQADFQNGVKMARYADKASEPRLRPTGRGELTVGEQIGTIDIRGRQHPVYDKLTIGEAPVAEPAALTEGAETRFMPLSSAAQAELSPEEKRKYTNFKKGNWTEVQDAPSITMHDLIGRKVFPSFADLTSGGRIYKGIDSSEIAIPIETHGGPEWPLIQPEKVGEETNVWSNQGAGVSSTKAKRANEGAIMLVTTMDKNAHISNTEIANAIIATNVAYARDKRIKPNEVKALDNRIKQEMPDFPGIQSPEINAYVSSLPFQGDNSRARLANVLSQKDAEELGAANVQRILDEMRASSYEGSRPGEAVMAIELTPGAPVVKLGEQGTMTHPSYQYAVRGRVIGKLDRPMHWEMIYDDFLNARRAEGKPKEGDRRAIDLAKPLQLITQEIADRIPQTKYQNIKSARHAQVLMKAVNGEWRSSTGKIKEGAVSPADFINTLNGNDAKIALDKYTLPEIKEKIKKGEITLHQLGDSQVYFATKPGDPATGYGKDPKDFGFGDNEKTLSLVLNGEKGTAGMGDAIVMKALQEGVTALDCFAVKSSKYPDGMLPALYGRFGFETMGEVPFDPSYYSKLELADLKRFWKKNGWDESTGYPPVVLMKWKGNESERTSTLLELAGQSSAGVRGRVTRIVGDARSGSGRASGGQGEGTRGRSGEGDTGRGGGSEGAALQGIQLSRGTVGAVEELFKMTAAELQNLGINPESVNKSKK